MGPLLVDLITAALVLVVLYARPTVVLGVLVGTVMLIPATLVAPHLHTSYATVDRLVIGSAALRLAVMARGGALRRDHFRATPLHLALALLAATWAFAGVVLAPSSEQPGIAGQRMVGLAAVFLFFIISLALLRMIDQPWLVLRLLTGTLALAAAIAVYERFTGHAYGRWLFDLAGNPGPSVAAHVLETRAGHVRVRASAEFALGFAWVCLMVLPAVTVVALRMRRLVRVGLPLIGLVLLAIYWTYSRSAAAAIPVIFVLLAIGIRDRRTALIAAAGVAASLVLLSVDPTIRHHLSLTTDQGSVGIRFQRLPPILAAAAHHPYLGLGLGGLRTIGVTTTDNFYLAAYSETGVVGAVVLIAFCVTALAQSARGLKLADSMRRSVVAASVLGFAAFLVSGVFDDALLLGQPAQLAVLLLAIATATAEPELGFARLPHWSPARVVLLTSASAAGALVGLGAYLAAPVVVSQERTFSTVSPLGNAFGYAVAGPALIGTICDLAHGVAPSLPHTQISCRDDFTAAGVGTLRVQAPTSRQTLVAYTTLRRAAHKAYYLTSYETQATGAPIAARATVWATAPASGAALGFAIAWIAPMPIRRRRAAAKPAGIEDSAGSEPLDQG